MRYPPNRVWMRVASTMIEFAVTGSIAFPACA
jgi:hypothetical protein